MMPSRSGGGSHIATHYGHPISVYAGKGALTLDTGQEIPCDFEAGQLANGEILVLCDWKPKRPELALGAMFQPPVTSQKLVGTTNDNCHIIAEGLTRVNYLAKSNRVDFREGLAECYYAFNARTLRVNG